MRATEPKLERLRVECPRHGVVVVVCPRCAGKRGGRGRKGNRAQLSHFRRMLRELMASANPERPV